MQEAPTDKIKEELRLSNQTLDSILRSITGCFFVLDRDWRLLRINQPDDGYLPSPPAELLGKTLWEIYPHWKGTECGKLLARALSENTTVHFEHFDQKQSTWYDMYALHMPQGLSIHFHNISFRKGTEDQLRIAHEDLEKRIKERTHELEVSNQSLLAEIVERKSIEREVLEVTQEEQRRFGSQLHDGLCQELTAIMVFAKGLTQKMEKDNRLDVAELKKISELLHGVADQARNTARGLYPGELEGTSLMHTLEELTANTRENSSMTCRFFCPEPILINDNDIATHLYKIAQEGISNAVKHAKAGSIDVSLTQNAAGIKLVIRDDGVGFDLNSNDTKGIGLRIMKYRAHMIGAEFSVEVNTPHGTLLKCSLKSQSPERGDS